MTYDLTPEDLPQDRAAYIAMLVATARKPDSETCARIRALLPPGTNHCRNRRGWPEGC